MLYSFLHLCTQLYEVIAYLHTYVSHGSILIIFLRIPTNLLLASLAVSDILYATFILPDVILSVISTHPEGTMGTILCKGGIIAWVGGASSIFTLVSIAVERYYAVMYPLGDKRKLTKKKLKVRH